MNEANGILGAIINGVFLLCGTLIGLLGTYLTGRRERDRDYMRQNLKQIKSFYNLESLYITEIERLRNRLPDEAGSKKAMGIKVEFRAQNEENGSEPITMTANRAEHLLKKIH